MNVDLLKRTLAHIEEHPEEWDQRHWRCETGTCFAGTVATLEGGRWLTKLSDDYSAALSPEPGEKDFSTHGISRTELQPGTRYVPAYLRAQRLLRLDKEGMDRLFDGDNTLDDLRRIVAELCEDAEAQS